jgi:phenylalanyl-tRNA synthetase beta chain
MPKIDVYQEPFYQLLGERVSGGELEELLQAAKAELDGREEDKGLIRIELNDTNRPDLWSTAGLARALRLHRGGKAPSYDFFSSPGSSRDAADRVVLVDRGLQKIRPFIAAFVARGKAITDSQLKDIIQTQEKLCWNYGQKRKGIAMGYYRADLVRYPVRYRAADPAGTRFVPLGMAEELSLRQILQRHPKGVEFAFALQGLERYPFLEDSAGEVLSFPPIINSARLGAVEVGDSSLFIELTGMEINSLLLAASITACDLADLGFEILPVRVVYPYDTPYGRELTAPFYFQRPQSLEAEAAARLLGEKTTARELASLLRKHGHDAAVEGKSVVFTPPPYRNDFLHPVDVAEEIVVARGLSSFEPVMPEDYTIGRLSDAELFGRRTRDLMVGLGFQEMIYNYLGSRRDFVEKMRLSGQGIIEIANPMTENYAVVRNSTLAHLLASEAVSANAVYPHRIFEIGKVAFQDASDPSGCATRNTLGVLWADRTAGLNEVTPVVSALSYYLLREVELRPADDPRFIEGRAAEILCGGRRVGLLGEIHPEVLGNWGIVMPCACAEIDLDLLMGPG